MDGFWYFWHWLRGYCGSSSLRWQLRHYMLEQITVMTAGGTVVGTLIFVGCDYIELIESNGDRVLVPFEGLESFMP